MTGWVYLWALLITIAAVAYGSGPYVASLFNLEGDAKDFGRLCSVCARHRDDHQLPRHKVAGSMWPTSASPRSSADASLSADGCSSLIANTVSGCCSTASEPVLVGVAATSPPSPPERCIALWMYYGFEACGDVAEEVPNPGRVIPKAMRRTIYVGGAAGGFICSGARAGCHQLRRRHLRLRRVDR